MAQAAFQFLSAHPLILGALKVVIVFTVLSGAIAFLVYVERKVLAFMQARLGPMRVGPWGALRSSAQLVSYEVAAGIAIVSVVLLSHSLSMVEIVKHQQEAGLWNVLLQPVGFFVYLVAAIAETNRSPFDLPEAESELTAGFHTEYSGFRFSLFFMAEYTAMVLVSSIGVTLFFGGWLRPFAGVHALDFLDYAPVASLLGFAIFIGWLAQRTPVTGERRFWIALAAGLVLLAVPVVPVLDKVQGIFWFSAKVIVF